MDTAIDLSDPSKALDLANIRFQLIRLEDTITFHLIERAQFPLNSSIYTPNALPVPATSASTSTSTSGTQNGSNEPVSFLDYILSSTERLHSTVRRYESPDELPFFPSVIQASILPPLHYPPILYPNTVNINPQLKKLYISKVLPATCASKTERKDSQENYGSAAVVDVNVLQALSRRVHFGKFVAESKFRKETERFVKLIKDEDRKGIDEAITNAAVEKKVLERMKVKAETYGRDLNGDGGNADTGAGKIDARAVVSLYQECVIPLTKEVEVEYLMQRLIGTEWE